MTDKLRDAAQAAVDLLEDDDRNTYKAIRVLEAALMEPKPWVGLTKEEAAKCWSTSAVKTWKNFEAKLKEKNGGHT